MSEETPRFQFTPLDGKKHDREAFSCGEPSLDNYLKRQATQDMKRQVAVTHAMTALGDPRELSTIHAFYTLSAGSVLLKELPPEMAKRMPGYQQIGVVRLGRLAVDLRFRERGFGGVALENALRRSLSLSDTQFGIHAVVVAAFDDNAKRFYEHHGFVTLPGCSLKLYLAVKTIADLG